MLVQYRHLTVKCRQLLHRKTRLESRAGMSSSWSVRSKHQEQYRFSGSVMLSAQLPNPARRELWQQRRCRAPFQPHIPSAVRHPQITVHCQES